MTEPDTSREVPTGDLSQWIGRRRVTEDRIDPQPTRFMQQTLDREPTLGEGDALPPAWHWLYFIDGARISETGRDGHAMRGGFLPPVSLPRRMWAGSRLEFHQPLRLGDAISRESVIRGIQEKSGRSGPLCFVTVSHTYRRGDEVLLDEEHDIVYREDPAPGSGPPSPPPAETRSDVRRTVDPSPLLLFRYSALTFNGHRIHYDIDYCRDVEGYPGLVFHGPLTATLLLDLLTDEAGQENIRNFRFRAMSPLFADRPFTMHLVKDEDVCRLWVADPDGGLAARAEADIT
ncbi:MAG: MaoC family dehydratase N-terminal domain-containing protein [Gammaproteobacteria bacterium]|nr:MaoC family dehydratase N-terminal domain-containing protein [Gammaproteobacteria bacterium]MDE0715747.1 MaoC family dehydratase N-terminal domain-containing protein [Gammaproteobacteria bacterium]MXY66423.1 acyl-CoA dehydrogenase [Gammaproteobacteria bacterium]MYG68046.1 acyl-CoA dehydrogenase [Gammaproteobacteria bacterium]